jgi:phosphatidylserine decarboxylase
MRRAQRTWPANDLCLARESIHLRAPIGNASISRATKTSVTTVMCTIDLHANLRHWYDNSMTRGIAPDKLSSLERMNFLLTNRIPRRMLTLLFGWFSKLEHPWIRNISLVLWEHFSDLDLSEANASNFRSVHDCFTRELKPNARPVVTDTDIITSPCDAIVGACGQLTGVTAIQAKGFSYSLHDLLHESSLVELYRDGVFVTLRLTASMYHRFHAPYDCRVGPVTYISGDTWNVNPAALRCVEKLFCKNERAIIRCELPGSGITLTLVPVAAILVAGIRLHFADVLLHLRYGGPSVIRCAVNVAKGEEMGWFEHGSTIIVFAPASVQLHESVESGLRIKAGRPLFRLTANMV